MFPMSGKLALEAMSSLAGYSQDGGNERAGNTISWFVAAVPSSHWQSIAHLSRELPITPPLDATMVQPSFCFGVVQLVEVGVVAVIQDRKSVV